jgi:hypothetical protein
MTRTLAGIALCCALMGCKKTAYPSVDPSVEAVTDSRFNLKKVGQFHDDDAHSSFRTVYILTDRKTGAEFVGVSGIGISELTPTGGKPVGTVEQ